ncbi:cytochrome c oxidase subunit 3 [Aromatoleum petrolei]|uniref:Cytochrome c oxidase subunit 3 family protein n=1 Tax=Aromatoleum petrolei TaxID=76116 RepID=A0ABX1MGT0_9RHOO|nr:cytochrome c oxidase subunit 3 [Aromatoleum petrolei]NMF87154.1 cytochrome c oxidase subunit 3 family protein [Aromatoleum petrolei]QTQ34891.1 Cytochrome c oxidase, subunit III [Aromatoleum petrolei]
MPDYAERGEAQAPAIWTFVTADILTFTLFFAVFMHERGKQVALFNESAVKLDAGLGLLNTLILITSGWLVALALSAARAGDRTLLRRRLLLALIVGSGFAVTKVVEYHQKISHGITLLTNDFFMFYYALTGIHFLHFLVGVGVLLWLWVSAANRELDDHFLGTVESGGLYWHMVDLLWLVLFPLLYLLLGASA